MGGKKMIPAIMVGTREEWFLWSAQLSDEKVKEEVNQTYIYIYLAVLEKLDAFRR